MSTTPPGETPDIAENDSSRMDISQSPKESEEEKGISERNEGSGSPQEIHETETNSQSTPNTKEDVGSNSADEPESEPQDSAAVTEADTDRQRKETRSESKGADEEIEQQHDVTIKEEETTHKPGGDSENMEIDIDDEMDQEGNNGDSTGPTQQDEDMVEMPETLDEDLMLPEFTEGAGTRKDRSLLEFLESMDQYTPIIPDQVTDYYLSKSGFETSDVRIKRLLALATQKFVSDIATDAYQYSRIRSSTGSSSGGGGGGGGGASATSAAQAIRASRGIGVAAAVNASGGLTGVSASGQPKVTLTMEDLASALAEYGVNVKRPDFYR